MLVERKPGKGDLKCHLERCWKVAGKGGERKKERAKRGWGQD
jgi:hypothetical protein